ncbi:unnamed protein product [Prorocentrum cordatum]|uniref:Uncharacterized protein n=1 Tax=Prorocentrum cordatum TaxID=2364126 RepID=A0ABN9R2X1_9DINO|nr:unnamed protein product [Polarella glacialis]
MHTSQRSARGTGQEPGTIRTSRKTYPRQRGGGGGRGGKEGGRERMRTKDGGRVDQTASRPPGAGTMAASNIKTLKRPAQAYSRSSALDLWRHGETTTTEVPQLWPPEARSGRRGPRRISRDEQLVPAVGSGAPRTLQ